MIFIKFFKDGFSFNFDQERNKMTNRLRNDKRILKSPRRRDLRREEKKLSAQGLPEQSPPEDEPRLKPLNFEVRVGSGAFGLVWPITMF